MDNTEFDKRIKKQDDHLDIISKSVSRLGDIAKTTGNILDDQNNTIIKLHDDVNSTNNRLKLAIKKENELISFTKGLCSLFILTVILVAVLCIVAGV